MEVYLMLIAFLLHTLGVKLRENYKLEDWEHILGIFLHLLGFTALWIIPLVVLIKKF